MKPTPPPQQFVNRPPDAWILVRVLTVIAGSPQTYTAEQWELGGGGTWAALTGGEQVTANNAGYTLPAADDSEITLAVDDFAWARLAPIAGGLFWELVPASSTYTPPDPDTGTAVSCGWLAGLLTTQCLTLTVLGATGLCADIDDTQELVLTYGASVWTSTADFTHDTGTGPAIFSITADGVPKLTIDAIAGVQDGCGTDADGNHYADWAFGGTTLCDGTAGDCGGNIFRVRLTCSNCPDACCPDDPVPDTLYLTITSAACPAIDDVVTLSRGVMAGPWATYDMWYGAAENSKWWVVYCDGADYCLELWNADPTLLQDPSIPLCTKFCGGTDVVLDSCDPFHISFTFASAVTALLGYPACLGGGCPSPMDIDIDIVE